VKLPTRKQTDLLVKFMGMTGSAHDGEALNALRHAQKLLSDLEASWADVVAGKLSGTVSIDGFFNIVTAAASAATRSRSVRPTSFFTYSVSGERYTDSDVSLIFEPMRSFPFQTMDRVSLMNLWTRFTRERRLTAAEFSELLRLQKICARGIKTGA
jgi:hypothetical protein